MATENGAEKKQEEKKQEEKTSRQRALDCAKRFFERKGCEVLEVGWKAESGQTVDLVVDDGGGLVFVDVTVEEDWFRGIPPEDIPGARCRMEAAAAAWLACSDSAEYADCAVRFDMIAILVLGSDRALLRHHQHAFEADLL